MRPTWSTTKKLSLRKREQRKNALLAVPKTKNKDCSKQSQYKMTAQKKTSNSGDRRVVVVVVVVDIKRDVVAAASQRDVLVSAEERC